MFGEQVRVAAVVLAWLAIGPAGAAEIYRCDHGGTTVFSDRPCADDAALHRSGNGLSIVAAPDDLETVSAQNREFVEQRRQRLAEHRRAAARADRQRESARRYQMPPARERTRTVFPPGFLDQGRAGSAPHPRNRERRRDDRRDDQDRELRRTLLSRSGGGRPLLRPDPPRYQ